MFEKYTYFKNSIFTNVYLPSTLRSGTIRSLFKSQRI